MANLSLSLLRCGVVCVAATASCLVSPSALAYGGLWSSSAGAVKQTAQRIVFVDQPDAKLTAIVELKYQGPAGKFAWVVPVPGKPAVGVSSNVVFERLDAVTLPQYWVEVRTEGMCVAQEDAGADFGPGYADGPSGLPGGTAGGVTFDQDSVGPYDYVHLTVEPSAVDPANVAKDWLTQNGYELTGMESQLLEPYLKSGHNLLAFKLRKGAEPGALRPVVLSYEGERPTIPLRPTALAAQDDMGLLVWVVGPSQAVPENYKSLVLNDALVDWLSGPRFLSGTPPSGGSGPFGEYVSRPSNYDALVTRAADQAGGHGFVTELAQPVSQFRDHVWSVVDEEAFLTFRGETYADGIDAVVAAHALYAGWDGWYEALQGATALPSDVTLAAFTEDPDAYRGKVQVDASKFLELLEARVVKPVIEGAELLHQAPYLTRLYTTLSPGEMSLDPSFLYNFDLAQLNNVHIAKQLLQCSPSLQRADAPWRMDLPQGGVVLGTGRSRWPVAADALPANLKIVKLSSEGAGSVVEDHSEDIGAALFEATGIRAPDSVVPPAPRTGETIGGRQTVKSYDPANDGPSDPEARRGDKCSLALGGSTQAAQGGWLLLLTLFLLRRRTWRHGDLPGGARA